MIGKFFNVFSFIKISFSDGWEVNGLIDHYTKKAAHRKRLEEQLKKEGKTIEDVIEPKYVPPEKSSNERERTTSNGYIFVCALKIFFGFVIFRR